MMIIFACIYICVWGGKKKKKLGRLTERVTGFYVFVCRRELKALIDGGAPPKADASATPIEAHVQQQHSIEGN